MHQEQLKSLYKQIKQVKSLYRKKLNVYDRQVCMAKKDQSLGQAPSLDDSQSSLGRGYQAPPEIVSPLLQGIRRMQTQIEKQEGTANLKTNGATGDDSFEDEEPTSLRLSQLNFDEEESSVPVLKLPIYETSLAQSTSLPTGHPEAK